MSLQPITLKPGVLFANTASGGTLMDILHDRFIALSPVSAAIWDGLASGASLQDLVAKIMQVKNVPIAQAEILLSSQFDRWEKAGLINSREPLTASLPRPKLAPPATADVCADRTAEAPLSPLLLIKLVAAELRYRRALRRLGLARTLVMLQLESGKQRRETDPVVRRTLRAHHALRRPFRQGHSSRDCLISSIVLAAVLRRQGIEADLCIGIRDLPFLAHAWVEAQGLVLNELLSSYRKFTVIGRF